MESSSTSTTINIFLKLCYIACITAVRSSYHWFGQLRLSDPAQCQCKLQDSFHAGHSSIPPCHSQSANVNNNNIRPSFGTTRECRYQKGKTNLDLLKQETVSGSGISLAICDFALHPRQITTPAPNHSVFYRPYALPAAKPTTPSKGRL